VCARGLHGFTYRIQSGRPIVHGLFPLIGAVGVQPAASLFSSSRTQTHTQSERIQDSHHHCIVTLYYGEGYATGPAHAHTPLCRRRRREPASSSAPAAPRACRRARARVVCSPAKPSSRRLRSRQGSEGRGQREALGPSPPACRRSGKAAKLGCGATQPIVCACGAVQAWRARVSVQGCVRCTSMRV
jgi:hypothetical protein